jgi:hypothetical protein
MKRELEELAHMLETMTSRGMKNMEKAETKKSSQGLGNRVFRGGS